MLLRLGLHYPAGKNTWGKAHMAWLAGQKLEHLEQRIALEEMLHAVRQAQDRIARLEQAIHAAVPDWSLAPSVTALMALRGIEFIAATTLLAEIGDLTRFRTPRELMAWLGMVPVSIPPANDQARPDHQNRQPAGTPHPGGVRLELSPSAAGRPRQADEGRGGAASGARHRLEGAVAADRALSGADPARQAQDRCHHRGRARDCRLHLGGRSRGGQPSVRQ